MHGYIEGDADEDLDRLLADQTNYLNPSPSTTDGPHHDAEIELHKSRVMALEETLDRTVIQNTVLLEKMTALESSLEDMDLIYQAKLLDKDMALTRIETELVKLNLDQQALRVEAEEAAQLREAVKVLTQWHVNLTEKITTCESELQIKTAALNESSDSLKSLEVCLDDVRQLCSVLEESDKISTELIQLFETIYDRTAKQAAGLEFELVALRQALKESVTKLSVEKNTVTQQLLNALNTKKDLEEQLEQIRPQLLPKWDERNALMTKDVVPTCLWSFSLKRQRLLDQMKSEWETILTSFGTGTAAAAHRYAHAVWISQEIRLIQETWLEIGLIAEFLFQSDLSDLAKMVITNPLSIRKEKSLVQWMSQTLKDFGDYVMWTSQLSNRSFPDSLKPMLEKALATLRLISDACSTNQLSVALPTASIAAVSQFLRQFMFPASLPDSVSQKLTRLCLIRILSGLLSVTISPASTPEFANVVVQVTPLILESLAVQELGSKLELTDLSTISLSFPVVEISNTLLTTCGRVLWKLDKLAETDDTSEEWSLTHFPLIAQPGGGGLQDLRADIGRITQFYVSADKSYQRGFVVSIPSFQTHIAPTQIDRQKDVEELTQRLAKTELELSKMKVKEASLMSFQESKDLVYREVETLRHQLSRLQHFNNDLERDKRDLSRKIKELESEVASLSQLKKTQALASPSVAAMELMGLQACHDKLIKSMIESANHKMASDWKLTPDVKRPDAVTSSMQRQKYREAIQLRNRVIEVVTRNPGIDVLVDACTQGERLHSTLPSKLQDVIRAQVKAHNDLTRLKTQWSALNLPIHKPSQDTTAKLTLRIPHSKGGRIIASPEEISQLTATMIRTF